jgi:5-methylcytosine-specific restriction endonuclease McrA
MDYLISPMTFTHTHAHRRYLTPKAKAALWQQQDQRCAECPKLLKLAETQWDHVLPLCLTGTNDPDNWQGLCGKCHAKKTRIEAGMRAKADRQRKFHLGLKKRHGRKLPSRPFGPSRGFDTSLRRKLSGKVEIVA